MKIGLMGLGNVGIGVYDLINNRRIVNASIVKVLVRNTKKERKNVDMNLLTDNKDDLDNIDILIEATGDYDLAYEMIKKHLIMGHSVVTANKEVIASNIKELTKLALDNNAILLYEASVGGGIPIISSLMQSKRINKFDKIIGILNGTTNFILSKCFNEGKTLDEAIKEAIRLGFAEADPSADLKGLDMARKMAILSKIAYNVNFKVNEMNVFGLNSMTEKDINFIKEKGLLLKFVAESRFENDNCFIDVNPIVISKSHSLAAINNEFNVVVLSGDVSNDLLFSGKGAGTYPTAYAILDDVCKILNNDTICYPTFDKEITLGLNQENNRYYIRKGDNCYFTSVIPFEEFTKLEYDFYAIIKD